MSDTESSNEEYIKEEEESSPIEKPIKKKENM